MNVFLDALAELMASVIKLTFSLMGILMVCLIILAIPVAILALLFKLIVWIFGISMLLGLIIVITIAYVIADSIF